MGNHAAVEAQISTGDVFWTRRAPDGVRVWVSAADVRRAVASAREYGMQADVRTGTEGRRFIQIHSGTGSSYAHYFWKTGADV